MKLGIICTLMKRFGKIGYYNSQEIGLGKALSAQGHQVIIYRGIPKNDKERIIEINPKLTIKYIPILQFGSHGYLNTKLLDKDFDGILTFSDNQIFVPHLSRYCKKHHIAFVPYVGTAHSLFEKSLKARVMNTLFALGTRRVYRTHHMLAKTKAAQEELNAMGAHDITVTPVGLDFSVMYQDFDKVPRDKIREEFGYDHNDTVIVCVSRLEPDKRAEELIPIFKRLDPNKRYRLLIVGDGWQKHIMLDEIGRQKLDHKIQIVSNIPYENMWKVYKIADYYLNISRNEIFGMSIMEAIYYKIPVVASEALGPSLTLAGMPGHKLCATDDELVKGLSREVSPSPGELNISKRRLLKNFSWDKTAYRFLEAVKEYRKCRE